MVVFYHLSENWVYLFTIENIENIEEKKRIEVRLRLMLYLNVISCSLEEAT